MIERMVDNLKEIVAYCAANIVDWDAKCQLALTCIGNRMTIPDWFRSEIEDCVEEWCDDNEVCYDEVDWKDAAEEIVLWAE